MKIRKFLLYLPILFFLGCKTVQPTVIVRDSVVTYTQRDTILQTKADSATLDALLHCDSNYNVVLDELATANGERIRLSAELKNMQTKSNVQTPQFAFSADCKEDSLQHRIEWLEKQIKTTESQTIVQTVKYIPQFYKGSTIALWCIVAAFVIYVVLRIVIKIYAGR